MSAKLFRTLMAISGVLGAAALVAYFSAPWTFMPLPPANATADQMATFGTQYHDTILWDTWLQAAGSLLSVIFALGLVHLVGTWNRFAGRLLPVVCAVILVLSLMEGTFALAAMQAGDNGNLVGARTCYDLTNTFIHIFLLAPSLFLVLGFALRDTRLLPAGFSWAAIALGALFQLGGFVGLFLAPAQLATIIVLMLQELWTLAVVGVLLTRSADVAFNPSVARMADPV